MATSRSRARRSPCDRAFRSARAYLRFSTTNADANLHTFTPDANCTWLLTELDPVEDEQTAFGLCDLGCGFPELGYVSLVELATVRGRLGLPVERDRHFTATKTLSAYAEEATRHGHIRA